VKPPGYWREANFLIHLSGEVENAVGGSACGPIPKPSRRKRTLLQGGQLPDLGLWACSSASSTKSVRMELLVKPVADLQPQRDLPPLACWVRSATPGSEYAPQGRAYASGLVRLISVKR